MYKKIVFFVLLVLIPPTSLIYSMEKSPKNIFQQVELKNGKRESRYLVKNTEEKLKRLNKGMGREFLYDLARKCRNNEYKIDDHSAEELKEEGLINSDRQPIGHVKDIVLSAIKFPSEQCPNIFNMLLQSPIKEQEESTGALAFIELKNNSRVPNAALQETMKSLEQIKNNNPQALREMAEKCRNKNPRLSSDIEDKLKQLYLLQPDGSLNEIKRNIVLSAVEGDGSELKLIDPVKQ